MRIGILGSGKIGSNLGILLTKANYEVMISSRDPSKLDDLVETYKPLLLAGTLTEALKFGELIIIAIPFGMLNKVQLVIEQNTKSKIVVDATNPIKVIDGKFFKDEFVDGRSAGEHLVDSLPESFVVKAFNTIGYKDLRDKSMAPKGERMVAVYAGENENSKRIIEEMIDKIGLDPLDLGLMEKAKLMEIGGPFFNIAMTKKEAEDVIYAH